MNLSQFDKNVQQMQMALADKVVEEAKTLSYDVADAKKVVDYARSIANQSRRLVKLARAITVLDGVMECPAQFRDK